MLRVDKVIKPWKESAALNDHINLYGFWNETAFLTKSGDVGMVLSVPGVDYESLDRSEQEYAVKRLEAALKAFGPGFHVYQYLFKSNRPDIPFAKYDDPIVQAAIEQRRQFFEAKRDHLYQVEIFYCILLEGARSKTGVGAALARLFRDPAGAIGELKAQFTSDNMKTLLRSQIEGDVRRLDQCVQAFVRQFADFMQIEVLDRRGQFTLFRRLLNFDDWRVAGRPQSTQFLDFQVVNSNIEAERDHLRVAEQIRSGKTLLISGGTGTGKTTLLRILADFIPEQERLVVIEDTSELQIQKPNILAVECQTDTFKTNITFDDLLKSALSWRPDRIILGEVRGTEARTLLDSFNTGHSGSLATIHANSAEKALHRFANLVMRNHAQTTFSDTEAEIGEAVDFVVHVERQPGRRIVREVLALRGYDRDAKRFLIEPVFEVKHATA